MDSAAPLLASVRAWWWCWRGSGRVSQRSRGLLGSGSSGGDGLTGAVQAMGEVPWRPVRVAAARAQKVAVCTFSSVCTAYARRFSAALLTELRHRICALPINVSVESIVSVFPHARSQSAALALS